ncbi:MAG TPA: TetR/AcrR family transcriptional regulator [Drouetiella sp.]
MSSTKTNSPPKDKKEAIIEAMLDLVVERGFHDAPMSLLAKRSGASPGIIYHYFENKDDVIHAVYLHVKDLKVKALLEENLLNLSFKEAFIKLFANLYNFYRTHLKETQFLDLYEISTYCSKENPQSSADMDPFFEKFMKAFRSKKEGGILKDLPKEAVHEFSFGLIRRLAKTENALSTEDLRNCALASWAAIVEE